jgi:hypothetical protein
MLIDDAVLCSSVSCSWCRRVVRVCECCEHALEHALDTNDVDNVGAWLWLLLLMPLVFDLDRRVMRTASGTRDRDALLHAEDADALLLHDADDDDDAECVLDIDVSELRDLPRSRSV